MSQFLPASMRDFINISSVTLVNAGALAAPFVCVSTCSCAGAFRLDAPASIAQIVPATASREIRMDPPGIGTVGYGRSIAYHATFGPNTSQTSRPGRARPVVLVGLLERPRLDETLHTPCLAFGDRSGATAARWCFYNDTGAQQAPANQHRGGGDDGGLIWGGRDKTQGFERSFSDKTPTEHVRTAVVLTHLLSCWPFAANLVRLPPRHPYVSACTTAPARNVGPPWATGPRGDGRPTRVPLRAPAGQTPPVRITIVVVA